MLNFNTTRLPEVQAAPLYIPEMTENWKRWAYWHALDRAPMVACSVFNGMLREIEVAELYGAAAFYRSPVVIRVTLESPTSEEGFTTAVLTAMMLLERKLGKKACPSQTGTLRRVDRDHIAVDLLFAEDGDGVAAPESEGFSRRNSLDFHLKTFSRRLLERARVGVVRDETIISGYDGQSFARMSVLSVPSADNPVKVAGYVDLPTQVHARRPVLKGMMVLLSDVDFDALCYCVGIGNPEAFDVIVPAVTLKFDDGAGDYLMDIYQVFPNVVSTHATISIQAAERVPFTSWGRGVMAETFASAARDVMEAYRDRTGNAVLGLVNRTIREMNEARLCGDDEAEIDELETELVERFESLSATQVLLMSGLPYGSDKYLQDTLPVILRTRTKSIRTVGASVPALAAFWLEPGEVIVPRWFARKHRLVVGDRITIYRYPNTGIEMAEVVIVGLHDLDGVLVNPAWWAARFAGDFDGDLIGLLPLAGLVDEARISLSPSPKSKGKGTMTLPEAVARGFYAKWLVGFADVLVTIAAERGLDLEYPRSILQATVDAIKHLVAFPSLNVARRTMGLRDEQVSSVATLLRGRLGYEKRTKPLRYNGILFDRKNRPAPSWLKDAEKALRPLTVTITKERCIDEQYFQAEVVEKAAPVLVRIVKSVGPSSQAAALAMKVSNIYLRWSNLVSGTEDKEEAYDLLRELREEVRTSEHGPDAMRYLFAAVVLQHLPEGRRPKEADSRFRDYRGLRVFGFLPASLGAWNLRKAVLFMEGCGWKRTFNVEVR